MSSAEVLSELEKLGNPKNVAFWKGYGISPEGICYGVSLADISKLAQQIKPNQSLAEELWQTKIHDARLLATFISEPEKVTPEQLADQVCSLNSPDLAENFADNVVLPSSYAKTMASQWVQRNEEHIRQCGYLVVAALAKQNLQITNAFFVFYLTLIERQVAHEPLWVREAMNRALIAIGNRNEYLRKQALKVLEHTGPITIQAGAGMPKAPDATIELRKPLKPVV